MKTLALVPLISLSLLIAACAPSPSKTDHIKVVKELKLSCNFVRLQNCTSRRKNGDKRCYKRLKEMAVDANADTVLIDQILDRSEIIVLDNNAFGHEETIVEASLYRCNETSPPDIESKK